jgi:transposase InsO family protein
MLDQKKESAVAFLKAAFVLSQPWHHRCPRHDRQRIMLPGVRLPGRLPRSRAQTHPHQALHTENQRQEPALAKAGAERFIQTALREWAYAQAYPTSQRRAEELPFWLHRYNWPRPHGGIKSQTPISRLALSENNLLRLHS